MDEIFRPITWLEWPSTHQCTIQKIPFWNFMDGMKLFPRGQFTWSTVFIFFLGLFFPRNFFFPAHCFFLQGLPFHFIFFWPPLTPYVFWQLLPIPQIYLLPFLPQTHLPPSCCHASHLLIYLTLPTSFYLIPSFFSSPPSSMFEK